MHLKHLFVMLLLLRLQYEDMPQNDRWLRKKQTFHLKIEFLKWDLMWFLLLRLSRTNQIQTLQKWVCESHTNGDAHTYTHTYFEQFKSKRIHKVFERTNLCDAPCTLQANNVQSTMIQGNNNIFNWIWIRK